mgnify:CR=1 FL=1
MSGSCGDVTLTSKYSCGRSWHKNAQLHVSRDGECYADHAKFGIQSQVLTYYFDLETLFVIFMLSTPLTGIIIILSYLHTKHMIPLKIISNVRTTVNNSSSEDDPKSFSLATFYITILVYRLPKIPGCPTTIALLLWSHWMLYCNVSFLQTLGNISKRLSLAMRR